VGFLPGARHGVLEEEGPGGDEVFMYVEGLQLIDWAYGDLDEPTVPRWRG
jgi:hypothetical protein